MILLAGQVNTVVIRSYAILNLSLCIARMFTTSSAALSSCSMTRISRR
jgi:hypothetical protein